LFVTSRLGFEVDGGATRADEVAPLEADVARVGREAEGGGGGGIITCDTSPRPGRDFIGVFDDIYKSLKKI
jgi:hypothetical protein